MAQEERGSVEQTETSALEDSTGDFSVDASPSASLSASSDMAADDSDTAGDTSEAEDGEVAAGARGGTWTRLFGEALPAWLVDRLEVSGFMEPTPVQADAIDFIVRQVCVLKEIYKRAL